MQFCNLMYVILSERQQLFTQSDQPVDTILAFRHNLFAEALVTQSTVYYGVSMDEFGQSPLRRFYGSAN